MTRQKQELPVIEFKEINHYQFIELKMVDRIVAGLSVSQLGDSSHVLGFQFEPGANCGPVRLPSQYPYV